MEIKQTKLFKEDDDDYKPPEVIKCKNIEEFLKYLEETYRRQKSIR